MAGSPRTPPSIELPAALPPRVSGLLEQLQQLTQQILLTPLTLTIVELERDLMRHADVARNSQLQMDLLGQARHVMPMGEAFARHYLSLSGRALTSLHEADARLPADAVAAPATELSLVQDIEIDRDIVLADLARREAPRHASALHVLSQRMAVLAARPAYDIEQVPLSPHWLCRRLPQASSLLDLSAEASLVLYKAFGRMVFERQAELLERANSLLASQGVLPGLVYQPFLPRPAGRRRSAGPADADAPSPRGNSTASGNSASTSPAGTGGAVEGLAAANDDAAVLGILGDVGTHADAQLFGRLRRGAAGKAGGRCGAQCGQRVGVGLGVGGNLVNKDWIEAGEFDKIKEMTAEAVALVKEIRG